MTINFKQYAYKDKRGERAKLLPQLNRTALASATGVSRAQISRIVNGSMVPSLKTLRKIATALGATLDEVDTFLKQLKQLKTQKEKAK